jgi:hypothetical protein
MIAPPSTAHPPSSAASAAATRAAGLDAPATGTHPFSGVWGPSGTPERLRGAQSQMRCLWLVGEACDEAPVQKV